MYRLIRRTHQVRGVARFRRINELGRIRGIDDGHIIEKPIGPREVPLRKLRQEPLQEHLAVQFDDHDSRR